MAKPKKGNGVAGTMELRLVRIGDATDLRDDDDVKPSRELVTKLTEGGLPPFRVAQAPGVYWTMLHEPAKATDQELAPIRRLRVWRPSSGIITMNDHVSPSSEPGFRDDASKALLGGAL